MQKQMTCQQRSTATSDMDPHHRWKDKHSIDFLFQAQTET